MGIPRSFRPCFHCTRKAFVTISVGRTRIEIRCVLDWNWNEVTLELSLIIVLRSKCRPL